MRTPRSVPTIEVHSCTRRTSVLSVLRVLVPAAVLGSAAAPAVDAQVFTPVTRVRDLSASKPSSDSKRQSIAAFLQSVDPSRPAKKPGELTTSDLQVAGELTQDPCLARAAGLQGLFPVRNAEDGKCFWDQYGLATLKFATISTSAERSAVRLELASDVIGAMRVAIVGGVTGEKKSEPDGDKKGTDLDQFLGTGGNLMVSLGYPVAFRDSKTTSIALLFAPRLGTTVPALGGDAADQAGIFDFGGELQVSAATEGRSLGLFGQVRLSQTWASDTLYRQLGLGARERGFAYSTLSLGVVLASKYYVTWSRTVMGPGPLMQEKNRVAVTISGIAK